jgi:hypothetical protein
MGSFELRLASHGTDQSGHAHRCCRIRGTGRPRVPASIAFVGGPMPRLLGNLEKIAMATHAQEQPT